MLRDAAAKAVHTYRMCEYLRVRARVFVRVFVRACVHDLCANL